MIMWLNHIVCWIIIMGVNNEIEIGFPWVNTLNWETKCDMESTTAEMELRKSVILTFAFFWSVSRQENIDWCDTLLHCTDDNMRNTMCAYGTEDKDVGNCTDQKDLVQTNQHIRNYWLALHNTFRDQVAAGHVPGMPKASNMLQLVWDDVLTVQARRWAFQCRYEDDPCSRSPTYQNSQPEAIYNETRLLGKLVKHLKRAVLTRFLQDVNGYIAFPTNLIDGMDVKGFETFEQVNLVIHVFSRIREIGAALIHYHWLEDGTFHPFLKSNTYYGPPIVKGPVYQKGEPCSECPYGFKCNRLSTYAHLCAKPSDPSREEYTDGLPGAIYQRNEASNVNSKRICSSLLFTQIYFQIIGGS